MTLSSPPTSNLGRSHGSKEQERYISRVQLLWQVLIYLSIRHWNTAALEVVQKRTRLLAQRCEDGHFAAVWLPHNGGDLSALDTQCDGYCNSYGEMSVEVVRRRGTT